MAQYNNAAYSYIHCNSTIIIIIHNVKFYVCTLQSYPEMSTIKSLARTELCGGLRLMQMV